MFLRFLFFLLILILQTNQVFSQQISFFSEPEVAYQCVVSKTSIDQEVFRVTFDITNTTQFKKMDLSADIRVFLSDMYNNAYNSVLHKSQGPKSNFSVYPGQSYQMVYAFERPVFGVDEFMLHVLSSDKEICSAQFRLEDENMSLTSEDIIVVHPKMFKQYHPGETVFLELNFSEKAGKPSRVHILFVGHVFTDANSQGRYEVRIPTKNPADGFEIIVIGEWTGDDKIPVTVSKTIYIDVADNGVS